MLSFVAAIVVVWSVGFLNASSLAERAKVVVEGVPVNFTCQQHETDNPTFVWYINDSAIHPENPAFKVYQPVTTGEVGAAVRSSTIEVTPKRSLNGSRLVCHVYGNKNRMEEWILEVLEFDVPVIEQSDPKTPLVEGTTCTFLCTVNYATTIKWYIEGELLQDDVQSVSPEGGTTSKVSFIPQRRMHRRRLRCEVPREGLTDAPGAEVVLHVSYPPSIETGRSTNPSNTTLWCRVDANPPANISWFGPRNTVMPTGDLTHQKNGSAQMPDTITSSDLTVDHTNVSTWGVYKCIAHNMYGVEEASFELSGSRQNLLVIIGVPILVVSVVSVVLSLVAVCVYCNKRNGTYESENPYDVANLEEKARGKYTPRVGGAPPDMARRPRLSLPRT